MMMVDSSIGGSARLSSEPVWQIAGFHLLARRRHDNLIWTFLSLRRGHLNFLHESMIGMTATHARTLSCRQHGHT